MGLGILESRKGEHVPGTTRYYDDASRTSDANTSENGPRLKRGSGGIILIPQPSDDPNDPLNWPLWRRDLITFILCFAGVLATALGPILAANTVTLSIIFVLPFTKIALLTGYFLFGAGAAAIFFVPSGRIWGKRHLFLLGLIIVVVSSAWGGANGNNYDSFLASRVWQGVGVAPYESMLNAAVGDLYFVHQRGVRMAFTNLAVFGGAFFTPIVVGKITHSIGYEWTFYLVAIFTAATLPLVFLFCPETAYRRDERLNSNGHVDEAEDKLQSDPAAYTVQVYEPEAPRPSGFVFFPPSSARQPMGDSQTPKKTFIQSISLFDGRKTNDRYWVLLLRPFPLLMNPAFIWGCLIQGTMIGWTIFLGVLIAAVFIGPPYLWGEVKAGYTYTGPFIGAICGFIVAGILADTSVKFLTKRNKGIYEPEFRILLVIPMMVVSGIGMYGFAITASEILSGKYTYVLPLVFFGFEVAGMVIGAVASSLYIVDAYSNLTIEGFTLMIIFKNFFSFFLTFYAYDWLSNTGIRKVLVIISSVQIGICMVSVPMYVYGKRCRAFFHRHDPIDMSARFFMNLKNKIVALCKKVFRRA